MKHATPAALHKLEALLRDLRKVDGLKERSHGVFYRGSRAFLHFHEHGDLLFADVRLDHDCDQHPVTRRHDQLALLRKIRSATKMAKKNAK